MHGIRGGFLGKAALAAVMLASPPGCAGDPPPSFDPPRPVRCTRTDHRLFGLSATKVLAPAGTDRVDLAGFSVAPPSGPGWCRAFDALDLVDQRRGYGPVRAVWFAPNAYYGQRLSASPPEPRLRHTLLLFAFLGQRPGGGTWDMAALRHAGGHGAPGAVVVRQQSEVVRRFGTECLHLRTLYRQGRFLRSQDALHCLHPADARFQVTLTVSEMWIEGSPAYQPPLTEQARAEYEPFLSGLRFSSDPPPPEPPPLTAR